MRKLIAISAMALAITSCASSTTANATERASHIVHQTFGKVKQQIPLFSMEHLTLSLNTQKVEKVISELKSRIGITPYVFSGDTPSGWDCSGLSRWAYEQLGIEIPHSADKQGHIGTIVSKPKIGDLVLFKYRGTNSYYHSSIYIGNGKVIHAGFRKGTTTQIISLDSPAFTKTSTETFVRLIPTL